MQILNIRKFGFLLVLLLSGTLIIMSCGDDDPEPPTTCETTNLTYENFAQDFLVTNCGTMGVCHVDAMKDNIIVGSFVTYVDAKVVVDRGNIKKAINHEDGISNMPKGELKLDDCSIDMLSAWIDAGAPEN